MGLVSVSVVVEWCINGWEKLLWVPGGESIQLFEKFLLHDPVVVFYRRIYRG